jgi:hypothetical protein
MESKVMDDKEEKCEPADSDDEEIVFPLTGRMGFGMQIELRSDFPRRRLAEVIHVPAAKEKEPIISSAFILSATYIEPLPKVYDVWEVMDLDAKADSKFAESKFQDVPQALGFIPLAEDEIAPPKEESLKIESEIIEKKRDAKLDAKSLKQADSPERKQTADRKHSDDRIDWK